MDAAYKELIWTTLMKSDVLSTNLHIVLNLLHDLILDRWFTENVVGSNAGLTAVHVLPPGYASEGENPEALELGLWFICYIILCYLNVSN